MKARTPLAALAALAMLALPAADGDAQRRSQGRRGDGPDRVDWTDTAVRTAEGGIRIGNPAARVKLVEYVSLTCDHCANFAAQGGERLFQDYVRRGVVSVEYRNYVRDAYDLAAAMVARCASPRRYFDLSHELLGSQPRWMGRVSALTDAQRGELRGMTPLQATQRVVTLLQLEPVARRHGVDAARLRGCLADQGAIDRIIAMRRDADAAGVTGTPTFLVNGSRVEVNTWATIEPLLRAR
jgi:protein-disulfide isomerase